jgi:hypothetical protein
MRDLRNRPNRPRAGAHAAPRPAPPSARLSCKRAPTLAQPQPTVSLTVPYPPPSPPSGAASARSARRRRISGVRATSSHPRAPHHGIASAKSARRYRLREVRAQASDSKGPPNGLAPEGSALPGRIREVCTTVAYPRGRHHAADTLSSHWRPAKAGRLSALANVFAHVLQAAQGTTPAGRGSAGASATKRGRPAALPRRLARRLSAPCACWMAS